MGRWAVLSPATGGKPVLGRKEAGMAETEFAMQSKYIRDFADWLDDGRNVHPCNVDITYHGYDILQAIQLSCLHNTRYDIPLNPAHFCDINAELRKVLRGTPDCRQWRENFAERSCRQ